MRDPRFYNMASPDMGWKYLRYGLKDNQPLIKTVRLSHHGYLKTSPGGKWVEIRDKQFYVTGHQEVVWIEKKKIFKDVNEYSVGNGETE